MTDYPNESAAEKREAGKRAYELSQELVDQIYDEEDCPMAVICCLWQELARFLAVQGISPDNLAQTAAHNAADELERRNPSSVQSGIVPRPRKAARVQ